MKPQYLITRDGFKLGQPQTNAAHLDSDGRWQLRNLIPAASEDLAITLERFNKGDPSWKSTSRVVRVVVTYEEVAQSDLDAIRDELVTKALSKLSASERKLIYEHFAVLAEPEAEPKPPALMEFQVRSSELDQWYAVNKETDGSWNCDCMDFKCRRAKTGDICKHIRSAQRFLLPGACLSGIRFLRDRRASSAAGSGRTK